ncbi:ABC transporter substrate-binding protein [Devriesea agamarum]|uniref:ABC transporter substrate-binding protein n=1 Tax=Devriesea agamarum TaxID=472569 RepID=UPI00071E2279|nr:sugar ABC transporter substrate-binding protein [Devriesea agamarum]
MTTRRAVLMAAGATGALGALAACSPSAPSAGKSSGSASNRKAVTFRLWDDTAKPAYEESFKAFTAQTGYPVEIQLVPWESYWTKLPLDIASGDAADVFWMNSANYVQFQQSGNLMNVSTEVGNGEGAWEKSVVDLYTRDGGLWGVPQLWDSIAVFYNKKLTEAAGVDPSALTFVPGDGSGDTLIEAARKLTVDDAGKHPGEDGFAKDRRAVYGFNAQADRQAVIGCFLASNGGTWQEHDKYVFDSPEGVGAFQYLSDLINKYVVAPSAADTNQNGNLTRDLFIQGKLGLFQSGPYNLKNIYEGVQQSFPWAIAPLVAGPAGGLSVVHGVVAAGNAKTKNKEGATKLLSWLGSAEGQRPIATHGVAFPAHRDVQKDFVDFWKAKNVDVNQFIAAAKHSVQADTGAKANAGLTAAMPTFQEILMGRIPAADGLKKAQADGNAAMG